MTWRHRIEMMLPIRCPTRPVSQISWPSTLKVRKALERLQTPMNRCPLQLYLVLAVTEHATPHTKEYAQAFLYGPVFNVCEQKLPSSKMHLRNPALSSVQTFRKADIHIESCTKLRVLINSHVLLFFGDCQEPGNESATSHSITVLRIL